MDVYTAFFTDDHRRAMSGGLPMVRRSRLTAPEAFLL